ncbi:hypothetical protein [Aedoeadaptatus coli]|uniref:hypothetical protein n=1 Tax=Aedoeadaptatus coli TaxID=2058292 RepID=UPI000D55B178|nr:hypothetical protein [Peptoniphilus coli]
MFDPVMTIKSGQFHHWEEEKDVICAVNGSDAFFLKSGECISGDRAAADVFFDAVHDYARAAELVRNSEDLKDLAPYLSLRILKQDPWEAVVGFILSSNNNLFRIRKTVLDLSKNYGNKLAEAEGLAAYGLPAPEIMAELSTEQLRALGAGYRDKYLIETARMVAAGKWDLHRPDDLAYNEAKKYLMQLPGVGPKVADCILLFGYGKKDAFPVDVWIKRAMARFGEFKSREVASNYAASRFGEDAGYIQQLLFLREREKRNL